MVAVKNESFRYTHLNIIESKKHFYNNKTVYMHTCVLLVYTVSQHDFFFFRLFSLTSNIKSKTSVQDI